MTEDDDSPHQKDELGIPEWEDDTTLGLFRLHLHESMNGETEYRRTAQYWKLEDDSFDDAEIVSDTITDLERRR